MSEIAPITSTEWWRAMHAVHLPPGTTFERRHFPHPDGTWMVLQCFCGQKHIFIDPDAEPVVQ